MTTPNTDLHRDFGKMEAGLEALKEAVREGFKDTNERLLKVEARLTAMESLEHRRTGAVGFGKWLWAALVAVAGVVIGHFWGT